MSDELSGGRTQVRSTQGFVHTLSRCWQRPSLSMLEVAWRWAFGIPALLLLEYEGARIWNASGLSAAQLQNFSIINTTAATETLAVWMAVLVPPALAVALWLSPLLALWWVAVSAVGRTLVLRRMDADLHARVGTLVVLQAVRALALSASFWLWWQCIRWAARTAVSQPLEQGSEPNLILYFGLAIVTSLGLFLLWGVVSWIFFAAPLLAMLENKGVTASLRAALRLGMLRSQLIEINLVLGIVKIALIVLAMVFSAMPVPFQSVATPEFMHAWYALVAVGYFVASDFFHVARLMSYLQMWKANHG